MFDNYKCIDKIPINASYKSFLKTGEYRFINIGGGYTIDLKNKI